MRSLRSFALLGSLALLPACPGNTAPPDVGRADTGSDGGGVDGGGFDGGGIDGGGIDGGGIDGGNDAALPDAPPVCGDGVVNGTEDCEAGMLGASTCESEGFDLGTLDCNDDCTFDTSGCRDADCGNGIVEGSEACDGTNLNGATCITLGHDAGDLSCEACALVEDACTDCGNGMLETEEACDGTDFDGETCVSQGFEFGVLACGPSCTTIDTTACSTVPHPVAGQVIVTEIMPDPATISDNDGEWFEVTNVGAESVNLRDCVFSDNVTPTPNTFTVTGDVVINAGARATFARTAMAGFTATYVYPSSWALANANDEVRLTCSGTVIDSVLYSTPGAWGFASGRSTSLDPGAMTASANDTAGNWCAGAGMYEATGPNLGTPGMANGACASPAEICTGSVDEDGDGQIDCMDPDCAGDPACVTPTEICTGGIDEDGDGQIDCMDLDCASHPACGGSTGPTLLFSEYVEGSSNNKALEILNTGTTPIDLAAANCALRVFTTVAGLSIPLTGTVAAGDVYVVCHMSASFAGSGGPCDQTSTNLQFNGDDAVVLTCGTTTIDTFGSSTDPGSEWGTGLTSTADNTLRRLCTRVADTDVSDTFTPATSWSGFATDTFDGLGSPACVTP